MESGSQQFFSDRVKTGVLGILFLGMIYILYTKVLADPFGLSNSGYVIMWILLVLLFVIGVISMIKACDPRPVVETMPEGMMIRTFLFFEEFVPWHEVVGVRQEQYTNRVVGMHGYAKVTSNFLRIYRPNHRSLAINLNLLNKRGKEFNDTLERYLNA